MITDIYKTGLNFNFQIAGTLQDNSKKSSFLNQIDVFIQDFASKSSDREQIKNIAFEFIEELNCHKDKDLALCREGLSRLLRLDIKEIQPHLISYLKQLLHIDYLAYDVKNNQSQGLIQLERQLSQEILKNIRSSSADRDFLYPFLDLYVDVLERLWLLPYLCEDRSSYALIVEQNQILIISHLEECLKLLKKENLKILRSIRLFCSYLFASIDQNSMKLMEYLQDVLINEKQSSVKPIIYLGLLHLLNQNPYRSIYHYEQALPLLENEKNYASIKNACINLGKACNDVYENEKAIIYYKKALEVAKDNLQDLKGQATAYDGLGNAFFIQNQFQSALDHYTQAIHILKKFPELLSVKINSYKGAGFAHFRLGNFKSALGCYQKAFEVLKMEEDQEQRADIYHSLGSIYRRLGKLEQSKQHHEKAVKIIEKYPDSGFKETIYDGYASYFLEVGEYENALKYYEKAEQVARNLGDFVALLRIYNNKGGLYTFLYQSGRARDCYEKALNIAKERNDQKSKLDAFINLGETCLFLQDYEAACRYYTEALELSKNREFSNPRTEGMIHYGLGCVYAAQKKLQEGQNELNLAIELAKKSTEKRELFSSYNNMGHFLHVHLDNKKQALEFYEKALSIANQLEIHEDIGRSHNNLGSTYEDLKEHSQAEMHYRKSIKAFHKVQKEIKEIKEFKITLFEQQVLPYLGLERVLLKANKDKEALVISDQRRSRALIATLTKNLSSFDMQMAPETTLGYNDLQKFAKELDTTFLLYSSVSIDPGKIGVWVIPPEGEIIRKELDPKALSGVIKDKASLFQSYPFQRTRGNENSTIPFLEEMQTMHKTNPRIEKLKKEAMEKALKEAQEKKEKFKENLGIWHEMLIAPIESYLPQNESQTVTIIPDGVLSQLPFAAFQDPQGKFLIEKHPLALAPSIHTLHLLTTTLQRQKPSHALIVGNPDTGQPKDVLLQAEIEAKEIGALLSTSKENILTNKQPSVSQVIKKMQKAKWIHIACHGQAGQKLDPHSIFEGRLNLTPDEKHPEGYLYAEQVADLKLQAEMVTLSACYSGTGKLQREGTIGPVWSFLAAGVSTVIATYWPLPESETTVQMMKMFYQHIKDGKNKAEALRKSILAVLEKEKENPNQWGAFYLSGLF